MRKLFLLLSFMVWFTACKQKPRIENAIFVDLDRPERVSLFDYFHSIELIPLETSNDVLVSAIMKMVFHENIYYALDPRQCIILVFDNTGKFLFKIDKKGQGAGEYRFIDDFNINPFSRNLELLEAHGSIHIWDLSGNYIETKKVHYPGFRVVHTLAALENETYVFHSMFQPKKIIYFNMDKQKLLHEEFEESMPLGSFSFNPYQYQDDWFFFRSIHPVVYKMGKNNLNLFFNLILELIPRTVEQPTSRKNRKETSLKELKKYSTNFLT